MHTYTLATTHSYCKCKVNRKISSIKSGHTWKCIHFCFMQLFFFFQTKPARQRNQFATTEIHATMMRLTQHAHTRLQLHTCTVHVLWHMCMLCKILLWRTDGCRNHWMFGCWIVWQVRCPIGWTICGGESTCATLNCICCRVVQEFEPFLSSAERK